MTNQEAIEAIKLARSQVEWDYPMDYAAAFDKAIEALEQEPTLLSSELEKNSKKLEKDFGELDCISREQAIEWVDNLRKMDECFGNHKGDYYPLSEVIDRLQNVPSVTPQGPKTGYWISTETKGVRYAFWCRYKCSLCGGLSDRTNFCPNCGARMVEPQESEDKE